MSSLLAILAHPDDESFGPGGTLAKYAAEGVDVHIAIATDGAAGSVAEGYEESRDRLAEERAVELQKAIVILGATLHDLGYRDSGMTGDPANQHPDAWINADETEAVGRIVALIRQIKPAVVLTHDETGGYFHPDHIQCWKITTAAFHAAGDPERYPEIGPEPFQPERLYYTVFPKTLSRIFSFLARLRGQDPTKVGRNKDIDLTRLGQPRAKIHTKINFRPYWNVKAAASAEHKTQGGGRFFSSFIPAFLLRTFFGTERFMRAYPPAADGFKESSFFEG